MDPTQRLRFIQAEHEERRRLVAFDRAIRAAGPRPQGSHTVDIPRFGPPRRLLIDIRRALGIGRVAGSTPTSE